MVGIRIICHYPYATNEDAWAEKLNDFPRSHLELALQLRHLLTVIRSNFLKKHKGIHEVKIITWKGTITSLTSVSEGRKKTKR